MTSLIPKLAIVVPAFNEGLVLEETSKRLNIILDELIKSSKIEKNSFILFVDDGSKDNTWPIIKELHQKYPRITGLKLSKNFGHQNALLAGFSYVKNKADCIISVDADLQMDEKAIHIFIEKYLQGFHIVYGVRKDRQKDSFFKRTSAELFYGFMRFMGINIIKNHCDHRLISSQVLEALLNYEEVNIFLRGILPEMGFKSTEIYYDHRARFAGKTKYSLKKMISFALTGIISSSIVPIRLISITGLLIFIFSIVMGCLSIIAHLQGRTIAGWTSLILAIYLIGGIQLLSLGLIGEYIGKIYMETKKRPRFIIEEELK